MICQNSPEAQYEYIDETDLSDLDIDIDDQSENAQSLLRTTRSGGSITPNRSLCKLTWCNQWKLSILPNQRGNLIPRVSLLINESPGLTPRWISKGAVEKLLLKTALEIFLQNEWILRWINDVPKQKTERVRNKKRNILSESESF